MLLEHTSKSTQSEPIPGGMRVESSATGYRWLLDDWQRVDRFLVLGAEGGTYYVGERELVIANASAAQRCLAVDGLQFISRIVAISESGRAPKNDPAIFLLAMAAKLGDEQSRRAAYAALPRVCRLGTHLMQFAHYAQGFGGWGRGMRKAVGAWFNARPATELAYQLAKYQVCDGWSNRDLLRLAHPRAASPSHDRLYAWAVGGQLSEAASDDPALALIVAMRELATMTDLGAAAELIRRHRVPRECVPPSLLRHLEIWEALLEEMPLTALLRNLATMTRVGLIAVGSAATAKVTSELRNADRIAKARVHPLAILAALTTYRAGRSKGDGAWIPVIDIVDALDAAFYTSFGSVEPANKRMLLALDVSGSMSSGSIAGVTGMTPRIGSAAMAMVTAATEPDTIIVGFTATMNGSWGGRYPGGTPGLSPLAFAGKRLDQVVEETASLPFGGTDCALPMIWAAEHEVDVDTFVIYTDSETWAGNVHPAQALETYRNATGIPAKLVVVGMTSNGFAIANPDDAGMLDVVGFDTSSPLVLSDFARA